MNSCDKNDTVQDVARRPRHRILVADDEELIRHLLAEILTGEGYDVVLAGDGEEAIKLLSSGAFDLIITDSNMPGVGGLEVVAAAKRIDPSCPVIVISGHPYTEGKMRLVSRPRVEHISKPFGVGLIRGRVAKLLES